MTEIYECWNWWINLGCKLDTGHQIKNFLFTDKTHGTKYKYIISFRHQQNEFIIWIWSHLINFLIAEFFFWNSSINYVIAFKNKLFHVLSKLFIYKLSKILVGKNKILLKDLLIFSSLQNFTYKFDNYVTGV